MRAEISEGNVWKFVGRMFVEHKNSFFPLSCSLDVVIKVGISLESEAVTDSRDI